ASRERLDVARMLGGIAEHEAQPVDGGVQTAIEIDEHVGRPQLSLQLVACDQPPWVLEQDEQDLERLPLQLLIDAVPPQLARPGVELEGTETEDPLGRHVQISATNRRVFQAGSGL